MPGFAALLWFRGEVSQPCPNGVSAGLLLSESYLRDSRQRNADRRKEPTKPPFLKEKSHVNFQRKTR